MAIVVGMPKAVKESPGDKRLIVETGLRLVAIREIAGLSQLATADLLQQDQSTWSKWEAGKRNMPPVLVMIRFAARFRCSLDTIYQGALTGTHPSLAQALRKRVPELVYERSTGMEPDMDMAQASYRAAIQREVAALD